MISFHGRVGREEKYSIMWKGMLDWHYVLLSLERIHFLPSNCPSEILTCSNTLFKVFKASP